MDASRFDIYNGTEPNSNVSFLSDLLKENCDKHKIDLIDMTDAMTKDFEVNKKMFNSKYDGHWDTYGHEIVSKQLVDYMKITNRK